MTPPLTVTATLQDIFGAAQGSAANPSKLCFTLCGFGPAQPRIAGTSLLARVGPVYVSSTNGSFSTLIWPNDSILPAGTYYTIEVIDSKGNVVQADAYELTGSGTVDLSNLTPILAPAYSTPSGYILIPTASGALAVDSAGWSGPVTVDIGLAGDVTLSLSGFTKGQIVEFIIRQNPSGNHTLTWPAAVKNPALINPFPSSISTQSFIVDYLGNLFPQNGWQ